MKIMKTVRLRPTRVMAFLAIGCVCLVVILKTAVDSTSYAGVSKTGGAGRKLRPGADALAPAGRRHNAVPEPDVPVKPRRGKKAGGNQDDGRGPNVDFPETDRKGGLDMGGGEWLTERPRVKQVVLQTDMPEVPLHGRRIGGAPKENKGGEDLQRLVHVGEKENMYNNMRANQEPGGNGRGAGASKGSTYARAPGYPMLKNGKFIPQNRIVHFDLKGAAPKIPYILEVLRLLPALGVTGVLLEWEDMFPFTGKLAITRNGYAYSAEDIKLVLRTAKDMKLEVIPLVQTFGHLEFILKLQEFRHLRESDRYPQTICLTKPEAFDLIRDLIDQYMLYHSGDRYFHIGADEAFQIGMCDECQKAISELQGSRERLMIKHIAKVANYVREKYGKIVLVWHDMLNNVEPDVLNEYNLGAIVEPVVWAYAENLADFLMPDMWARFANVFPYIWGASAYKGADGPSRYYSNVPHYLQNHISWLDQMSNEYQQFRGEFRGLIFTGWQRFDHFAVLCEILPVGLPSMAVNTLTILNGQYERSALKKASQILSCSGTLDIDSPGVASYCEFPGAKVYQMVQQLRTSIQGVEEQLYSDYQLHGWLSSFNMRHNYSQAWYLDQILDKISMFYGDLQSLSINLRSELERIFFPDMVQEFLYTYVDPHVTKLHDMAEACRKMQDLRVFPKRPFPILRANNTDKNNRASNNRMLS